MPNSQWREPSGGQSPENLPQDTGEQRVHQQGEGEAEEKQSQPQPGPGRGGPTSGVLTPVATPRGATCPPCVSYRRGTAADNAVSPQTSGAGNRLHFSYFSFFLFLFIYCIHVCDTAGLT